MGLNGDTCRVHVECSTTAEQDDEEDNGEKAERKSFQARSTAASIWHEAYVCIALLASSW